MMCLVYASHRHSVLACRKLTIFSNPSHYSTHIKITYINCELVLKINIHIQSISTPTSHPLFFFLSTCAPKNKEAMWWHPGGHLWSSHLSSFTVSHIDCRPCRPFWDKYPSCLCLSLSLSLFSLSLFSSALSLSLSLSLTHTHTHSTHMLTHCVWFV